MPEGDTIYRTGTSLRRWLDGREVTAARGAGLERVVGATVAAVETRGKHLLIRFSNGLVLHTHMRMTGSWHVYPRGSPWRRPARQARAVLECSDRVAVCFNAPVVELLRESEARALPSLARLGPDVLDEGFDLDEVVRRAAFRPPTMAVGELLLDQTVLAGLGNVYRCEALFLECLDPWLPRSRLDDERLRRLVTVARTLISVNAGLAPTGRDTGLGPDRPHVYGRVGRPCRRCRTLVRTARLGADARTVFWCPSCQCAAGVEACGDPGSRITHRVDRRIDQRPAPSAAPAPSKPSESGASREEVDHLLGGRGAEEVEDGAVAGAEEDERGLCVDPSQPDCVLGDEAQIAPEVGGLAGVIERAVQPAVGFER